MSDRLNKAISALTPAELAELEAFAERLAAKHESKAREPRSASFAWVGLAGNIDSAISSVEVIDQANRSREARSCS
jgi:hypothetical protein